MSTEAIRGIEAAAIADSRGTPTLRVTVHTENHSGAFDVPSGASTGSREAFELRDESGKGVGRAIDAIHTLIAPALTGTAITAQKDIDDAMRALDGTPNKSRLGGNSMIGVSIAAARAAAHAAGVPLFKYLPGLATIAPSRKTPRLFVNLINGGKHAVGGSPFQEHQIVTTSEDPVSALHAAESIEAAVHEILTSGNIVFTRGDEGGVVFPIADVKEPFELLKEALTASGMHDAASIGTDIAASSFFSDGRYSILGQSLTAAELGNLYGALAPQCGITSIEDPFAEDDMSDFTSLSAANPALLIIGDDLTTTNASWVERAAKAGAINAVIIKPNQAGTLSETLDAMRVAREHGVHCIVSHRSGDTMDDFIADLAFAFGCYGLKAGAPSAPERAVKYKRLIEIAHA
jgi:enolase